MQVQAAGGSFDTRATEMKLAGQDKSGSMAWSVTGRFLRSDEMDLSRFPGWQYDLTAVSYRNRLRVEGFDLGQLCVFYHDPFDCGEDDFGNIYEVTYDEQGRPLSAVPTDAGIARARELDQAAAVSVFRPHRRLVALRQGPFRQPDGRGECLGPGGGQRPLVQRQ